MERALLQGNSNTAVLISRMNRRYGVQYFSPLKQGSPNLGSGQMQPSIQPVASFWSLVSLWPPWSCWQAGCVWKVFWGLERLCEAFPALRRLKVVTSWFSKDLDVLYLGPLMVLRQFSEESWNFEPSHLSSVSNVFKFQIIYFYVNILFDVTPKKFGDLYLKISPDKHYCYRVLEQGAMQYNILINLTKC